MSDVNDLWNRGTPLADAPERFAPKSLARSVAEPKPSSTGELEGAWKRLADQAGWDTERRQQVKRGEDAFDGLIDRIVAKGTLRNDCCNYVLRLLSKHKAIAVGYPSGATGEPEIIPVYLFENPKYIDWRLSSVAGNGLKFVSVRVVRLRHSEKLPENAIPAKKQQSSKVGRKASSEVVEIIRELNRDPDFEKKSGKQQAELVRENAITKYPKRYRSGRGLSQKTIYRYLHKELGSSNS